MLVNGFGLGERNWGGLSQFARLNAGWLIRIPPAFTPEQAMAIGTAGYTAMLAIQALENHGIGPGSGPVAVTGASGGVGSFGILLLAKLGYAVVASTGRAAVNRDYLLGLGARSLIERTELARASKPLESERWAGAIDNVGGETLATLLAQARYRAAIAACGLAGSANLSTTVMPFILRGVTLAGIDSAMASRERREGAWARLAQLIDATLLATIYEVRPIADVPALAAQILAGQVRGRVVLDVNA